MWDNFGWGACGNIQEVLELRPSNSPMWSSYALFMGNKNVSEKKTSELSHFKVLYAIIFLCILINTHITSQIDKFLSIAHRHDAYKELVEKKRQVSIYVGFAGTSL